jgi:hypothetical protein
MQILIPGALVQLDAHTRNDLVGFNAKELPAEMSWQKGLATLVPLRDGLGYG